jgi:PHD/YefM family antitoxin component YafN of YafNO toxin-antitoxin module
MPSPSPVPVVGEARAVCTIPLDRLQKLASSVLPLLNNEPVAVQKGGETCFYMVSPAMFSQLQMRLPLQEAEQPSPTRFVTGAEVNDSPTVAAVAERLLLDEGLRAERGAMSVASVGILRNRLKLHILPLMGTLPIHMVDADAVQHLVKRLSDRGSSPTTLSQYLVIVRKLLKLAFSRKWIR